jgi:hypothetical protein
MKSMRDQSTRPSNATAMTLSVVAALASILAAAPCDAMSPQQAINNMAGQWTCITHDSAHRVWRETNLNTAFGPWMRLASAFPAQNGQPAGKAMKYLGYDSQQRRWIVMSIDDSGGYYTMYSSSATLDGAHWIDAYPADHRTGYLNFIGTNKYTFDSSTPGAIAASHTVCTRS